MIPVIWFDQSRGNWDHWILLRTFEKHEWLFPQYNEKVNPYFDRAIVVLVGKPDVGKVREYLEHIKSGVVIMMSEEDAYFDWKAAIPQDRFEIWTQNWHQSTKDEITNRILLGIPYRKGYQYKKESPKKYLWSFVGQVQNPFRQECVKVLKKMPDGYMKLVRGFGGGVSGGVEYQEYLDIIAQSKFVICPSGSMTVETFRVFEAMECGSIPITDRRCPRDPEGWDYWEKVVPNNDLFTVNTWDDLPDIIGSWDDFPHPEMMNQWWEDYKNQLERKLLNLAAG